jgi:phage shock protein PspC (stress-responsive transcriptional regulator)
MENRLYRSTTDKMLGGVCAGLGKYLRIDVTLVRLFFIVVTLAGGFGLLLYLILWVVIPSENQVVDPNHPEALNSEELKERAGMVRDDFVNAISSPNQNTAKFIGIALVLMGGIMVMKQLNVSWLSWLNSGVIWAMLIVAAGVALLVRGTRGDK